ncbi:MAG: hypothetical protein A2428_12170 [Bdellovibrionales bacterium RIFOXYC1_FULL_54_43]|nr:MAG: hypothetical protein A2428_12170 [Bdellovibrionales bacterium RIFOXYC1_FULL_54_43]OFZ84339.1 MAG: hypothetical protein A2603_07480 [Bdellovibrionales bacterium RIFOXYD1_FULL_55_31]
MSLTPKNSWIDVRDFVKTSYTLTIKNISTHQPVKNAELVEVIELLDAGVVMKVPKNVTSAGHILMATIDKKMIDSKKGIKSYSSKLAVTGKVAELEPFNAEFNIITLQFYQFNTEHWQRFLREYEERQRAVDEITKKIQE